MLKPGGLMLYSTCTFDVRENEETIEYLLDTYPEFRILPMEGYEGFCEGRWDLSKSKNEDLKKTIRIFPHKMHGEGHYLALLQKGDPLEETIESKTYSNPKQGVKKIPEELGVFLKYTTLDIKKERLEIHGETVYYMPKAIPDIKGLRFLRTGLYLGDLKKNRFEPSQALAMYLKKEEYKLTIDLPVTDERVIRYLKGETIEVDDFVSAKEKGWYLLLVNGYPLGFGKLLQGTLKNKYLPGWRWQS